MLILSMILNAFDDVDTFDDSQEDAFDDGQEDAFNDGDADDEPGQLAEGSELLAPPLKPEIFWHKLLCHPISRYLSPSHHPISNSRFNIQIHNPISIPFHTIQYLIHHPISLPLKAQCHLIN